MIAAIVEVVERHVNRGKFVRVESVRCLAPPDKMFVEAVALIYKLIAPIVENVTQSAEQTKYVTKENVRLLVQADKRIVLEIV